MNPRLRERIAERNALSARIARSLVAEVQVLAAWIGGSVGGQRADAWSGLDLHLVVANVAFPPDRNRYAALGGEPLFSQEAPQNGPPGGMYLMASYDAPTGPHLVDWYWHPESCNAPETALWICRKPEWAPASEPPKVPPLDLWRPTIGDREKNTAALLSAMILLQAKAIARRPEESGLCFGGFLATLLAEVLPERRWEPTPRSEPSAKLASLQDLLGEMEPITSRQSLAASQRFLRFVAATILVPAQ